jgi:hypothetical protein
MIKLIVTVFLLMSMPLFAAQHVPKTLDEQLALDNPRVIKYLKGLTKSDIGKKLKGITLSDKSIALKNHIFLETISSTKNKFSVYIFRNESIKIAYTWVEPNGLPIPIPSCPPNYQGEGQYILSDDVYTWKEVQPGDGVVIIECVTDKWIDEIKKAK